MPYSDPEKQKEYLRDYYREYRKTNAAEIKARRAKWFQERKETARVLQRTRRALKRCEPGLDALGKADREAARAAITAAAAAPEMPVDALSGLWRAVSEAGRLAFLDALPAGRERDKWARVFR